MKSVGRLWAIGLFVVLFVGVGRARAGNLSGNVTLNAGQVLRIQFTTAVTSPAPDTTDLNFGTVFVSSRYTALDSSLYNGSVLLGTCRNPDFGNSTGNIGLDAAGVWKSPSSIYSISHPAIVDFSSVANGSINGRIDFSIETGSMNIDLAKLLLVSGLAVGGSTLQVTSPLPTVTSATLVPEPSCLAIALAPLLARRKKR